jgi:hypothetical protein
MKIIKYQDLAGKDAFDIRELNASDMRLLEHIAISGMPAFSGYQAGMVARFAGIMRAVAEGSQAVLDTHFVSGVADAETMFTRDTMELHPVVPEPVCSNNYREALGITSDPDPFTMDGPQVVCCHAVHWGAPEFKRFDTAAAAATWCQEQAEHWSSYTDKIEFTYYGYDPLVEGDNGEFIGTDGSPDYTGKWDDDEEVIVWEQA